jgi:hypothetical protein
MSPVPSTILPDDGTCRTCGKPLAPGSAVCTACGAAHGEGNRCPHCHIVADVEPSAAVGFRCLVCGGPRIALDAQLGAPTAAVASALASAGREQTKQLMYSAAGFLLSGMGALGLVIAAVVVLASSPGLLPSILAFVGASVPLGAGLMSLQRAARARTQRDDALHAARLAALEGAQQQLGPLDATRAANLLRISPEQAELLLAEVSVAALLSPPAEPRLRVEGPRETERTELGEDLEPAPNTARQRGQTEI